nr:single-stranded DNA-binding protein [Candidatus Cyrtobacter comes]
MVLIGNVGKDPEVRASHDGREVASFSLATSESWKDKNGEKREKTEWHRVVVFSQGLVNLLKSYVQKGSKLYVEGSLQTREWTDQTGMKRHSTEVVLQQYSGSIILLDAKAPGLGAQKERGYSQQIDTTAKHIEEDEEDGIPPF